MVKGIVLLLLLLLVDCNSGLASDSSPLLRGRLGGGFLERSSNLPLTPPFIRGENRYSNHHPTAPVGVTPGSAQEEQVEPAQLPDSFQKWFEIHGELKAHYRWSEDEIFDPMFPFPDEFIPEGQDEVVLRAVDPGSSAEISAATVILDLRPTDTIFGRVRIQLIDLYNRNPTSTDQTVNVKEAWMLFGKRVEFLDTTEGSSAYVLFGKAPKFERQPDRNLESYGLVSTAFSRFEDTQLQFGGNLSPYFYWRAQVSTGNPVFFRDPNVLAGDNGNDDLLLPNPELHLNSGFPILYDAEVEDVSFGEAEIGFGAGIRFQSEDQENGLDILGFYYRRNLAESVDLRGTFYGGDLDLLDGPDPVRFPGTSLRISGDDKEEFGGNVEARWKGLRIFFQGVHQDLAGLVRTGYEVEVAYRAGLPLAFSTGGKQLFTFIMPVVRLSFMDNDFKNAFFPAPSVFWDWDKYDVGVRVGIVSGLDLTAEYSFHDITAAAPVSHNEFLTTLRARF